MFVAVAGRKSDFLVIVFVASCYGLALAGARKSDPDAGGAGNEYFSKKKPGITRRFLARGT